MGAIISQTDTNLNRSIFVYVFIGIGIAITIGIVFIRLSRQSEELEQKVKERTEDLNSEILERKKHEERFRVAIEASPAAMIMVDKNGSIVFANFEMERLFGYAPGELDGQSIDVLVPEMERAKHPSYRGDFLKNPSARRMGGRDLHAQKKNGDTFPVEIGLNPIDSMDGMLVICAIVDLTERIKQEERFRVAIEASPAAMIMVDSLGDIVHANLETERLFGYARGELDGQSIDILVPEMERAKHPSYRDDFLENPSARRMGGRDLHAQKKNGDTFPVEIGLNPIDSMDGMLVICAIVDLTEQKEFEQTMLETSELLIEANKRLYNEATVDSLTNIANRRGLYSQIDKYLELSRRSGKPVSILMADIDYFKQYNDEYGHDGGDKTLKVVAETIMDAKRGSDFVARFGGEEFTIVLPDTDQAGVLIVGDKLRKSIEKKSGLERKITMSFGAATIIVDRDAPFEVESLREFILKQADEALYSSKENGRNCVTHYNDIG